MAQRSATLTPAYGRVYGGREAVLKDWNDGKDFMLNEMGWSGYCSIRNKDHLYKAGYSHLTFRNPNGHILVNVPLGQ